VLPYLSEKESPRTANVKLAVKTQVRHTAGVLKVIGGEFLADLDTIMIPADAGRN
jgi:hypothetical protein